MATDRVPQKPAFIWVWITRAIRILFAFLLLVTVGGWVRSITVSDMLIAESNAVRGRVIILRLYELESVQGTISILIATGERPNRDPHSQGGGISGVEATQKGTVIRWNCTAERQSMLASGFLVRWFPLEFALAHRALPPINHPFSFEWRISLPYWFLSTPFAIYFGTWLRKKSSHRRRRFLGLCPTCGYDLRASQDRCPECGSSIPSSTGPGV